MSEAAKEPEIIRWHAISITKDNIVDLIADRLSLRDIGPVVASRALEQLKELR